MSKKRILSILLLAAIVIFDIVYYMTHREDFQLLTSFSVTAVVVLVLLELLMISCLGLQVKMLTDHYGLSLTFWQWFGLARLTSLTNLMFGFAAGASVKAVYLKRFHNLKYGSFIAATGIAGIIKLMVMGLFATGLLLFLGETANLLLLVAGAIFVGSLLFLVFGHRIPEKYFSFWRLINDLVKEWRLIRHNQKLMVQLILLSFVVFAIYALEVYFAFEAFGISASISLGAVIAAFDNLAGAVKLIPGNVGIKEAIFGTISAVYGIGINQGVHAAVLHRIVRTAVSLVVGSGFAYQLIRPGQVGDAAEQTQKITRRVVS